MSGVCNNALYVSLVITWQLTLVKNVNKLTFSKILFLYFKLLTYALLFNEKYAKYLCLSTVNVNVMKINKKYKKLKKK